MSEHRSDSDLLDHLFARLEEHAPGHLKEDCASFVAAIKQLSPGLRAMAATHELDVSVTLDDLGWHFANWHHRELANETLLGLRELEATEAAAIFQEALLRVQPFWEQIGTLLEDDPQRFIDWYHGSELEQALDPLNEQMWALREKLGELGLFQYWVQYARRYPHRIESILH